MHGLKVVVYQFTTEIPGVVIASVPKRAIQKNRRVVVLVTFDSDTSDKI